MNTPHVTVTISVPDAGEVIELTVSPFVTRGLKLNDPLTRNRMQADLTQDIAELLLNNFSVTAED